MSRGTMFHVAADPDAMGGMSAEDFAGHVDTLNCDYVQDSGPEAAKAALDAFRRALLDAGFRVEDTDGDGAAFLFRTGDGDGLKAAQCGWFRDDLETLKSKVAAITLEEFACDGGPAYCLRELVNDPCGDAVYLDMGCGPCTYTMSEFIRNLEPGRVLYVDEATVYMH